MKLLLGIVFALTCYGSSSVKLITESVSFSDDLNFDNVELAISRQIKTLKRQANPNKKFWLGTYSYTRAQLLKTLQAFSKEVQLYKKCTLGRRRCQSAFSQSVNQKFDIYRPNPAPSDLGYSSKQTRFTAYYSPKMVGSFTKTKEFPNAIYHSPKASLKKAYDREQIVFENALKGNEAVYVSADQIDIWELQYEGGGVVDVNGHNYFLTYDGNNGKKNGTYKKFMTEQGMLKEDNNGIEAQKKYLRENPQDLRTVISTIRAYTYFRISDHEPLGVDNIELTPHRSMAMDRKIYKQSGLLSFIDINSAKSPSGKPLKRVKLKRFGLVQDTGSAIKSNARVDLYMGFGKAARNYAHTLHTLGKQYFLMLKKDN